MAKCATCTCPPATSPTKGLFIPWRQAGAMMGFKPQAVKKRILRFNSKPGVEPVRMIFGGVHRADFERWLTGLTRRPQTAQDFAREEAARIDSGKKPRRVFALAKGGK